MLQSPRFRRRPALALGASFAVVIALGSLFLHLAPAATRGPGRLSLVDSLFMATSATCVTGLETISTAERLSPFGQTVILFLIQVGGLGIMTLGTFLLLTSGARLGIESRVMIRDQLNVEGIRGASRLLGSILGITLAVEALGALCFYPWFAGDDLPLFAAVFHSVSAFCNAGFALRTDSFAAFGANVPFNLVAIVLITAGGLGFTVIREIGDRLVARIRGRRPGPWSLHARLTVITSFVLVLIGTLGFALLERGGVLAEASAAERVTRSVFQSVSARTAGFATVDFQTEQGLSQATRFFLIPLMAVGASPGSTGGGLKTVTLAVLFLGVLSHIRRRERAEAFGRSLPDGQVKQAATIAVLYAAVLCTSVLALLVSEHGRFGLDEILFEATSALATVGFSCGVSGAAALSAAGKVILVVLMFVGRLGPLTLVLLLGSNRAPARITYPKERVMIG